jgi:A/G-specific adenine glycosylase
MNTALLINWYQNNKRELPWRKTKDPYKIWLSEIILQQTRVAQGYPYYQKFIDRYPTIEDLAAADEQEILKLWQGLGYYSRARHLHQAARDIVSKFKGIFPDNFKDLLQLKGVGQYTAAAIASFAYKEPVAVLDGNVFRVLSRYYGIDTPVNTTEGKKIFQELAQKNLDKTHPDKYNQAIMEFGALQCTAQNPRCEICPLQQNCLAYQTGKTKTLPVKLKKMKIKKRYFHYFLIRYQNQIVLQKREKNDIWKNLYQLPVIELPENKNPLEKELKKLFDKFNIKPAYKPRLINKKLHKLTHQHLQIYFWVTETKQKPLFTVEINELNKYPMPIIIANFLDNSNL